MSYTVNGDELTITWNINDVIAIARSQDGIAITREQAREILNEIAAGYDASVGIDRTVIETNIDMYNPGPGKWTHGDVAKWVWIVWGIDLSIQESEGIVDFIAEEHGPNPTPEEAARAISIGVARIFRAMDE